MKKSFLINFLLLFFVNILVKPAWLFSDLLVQRSTGQDYGQYFVLFNLSVMLNMLLDLGTSNYNNRKIAGNEHNFKGYFSKLFTLRILLSAIYLLFLLAFGWGLSYDFFQLKMLAFLGVNQVLLATLSYFRSNLTALGHFKYDSLISVTDRVIMSVLLLGFIFLEAQKVSIDLFVQVQFVGYLLAVILAFLLLVKKGGWVKPSWNFKFNKTLLQKSYPYALIVVIMSAYSYSDSIMLDQLLDNGVWENTIYAQSFRILMAANNYTYLVAVLLLPMFAKMIKERIDVTQLLRLSGSILIFGTLVLALLFHVFSYEIINLLYAHYEYEVAIIDRLTLSSHGVINLSEVQYSTKVFACLVLGIVPMSFNYIYGVLLTAGGNMKTLNLIALVGLGANLLLNAFLIPNYGAFGAATASVITQGLSAAGQWFFCYQEHKISFPTVHFFKFVTITLVLYFTSTYLQAHFEPILAISITLSLSFIALLTLRIITWTAVKRHLLKK